MRSAPAWWRAIGGPWCVSVWSGVIGLIFVIPAGIWTAVYSSLTVPQSLVTEFIAAGVGILILWWAHAWWLSPDRAGQRHRAWIAVATFAVLGLIRIAVLFGARAVLSIEQPWSVAQAIFTGGAYSIVILGLVAIVVDAVRQHARTMEDLEHAQQSLARVAEVETDEVEALQRAYVEQVVEQVRIEISELRGSADPVAVAAGIQEVSDRLVRAGSHSLQTGEVVEQALTVPRPRVGLRNVLSGVRPAAPVIGPVAFEALVFTAVVRDFGLTLAVVNAVVATTVLIAGNLLLGRVARRHWPSRGRLPLLFVSYLAIGLAATITVQGVFVLLDSYRPMWIGALSVALFMTLASIIPSMRRLQEEAEVEFAESLAPLAAQTARVRALAEEQRRRLSHLMHGGLQAEMTAAAMAVSRSLERGDPGPIAEQRIDDLVGLLSSQPAALDVQGATQSLDEVVDTWRLALEIDFQESPGARAILDDDPELSKRLVDVVSEALTNAVRHSVAREVSVRVSPADPDGLCVVVEHPGALARQSAGLGSQTLNAVCEHWALTAGEGFVRFEARLSGRRENLVGVASSDKA